MKDPKLEIDVLTLHKRSVRPRPRRTPIDFVVGVVLAAAAFPVVAGDGGTGGTGGAISSPGAAGGTGGTDGQNGGTGGTTSTGFNASGAGGGGGGSDASGGSGGNSNTGAGGTGGTPGSSGNPGTNQNGSDYDGGGGGGGGGGGLNGESSAGTITIGSSVTGGTGGNGGSGANGGGVYSFGGAGGGGGAGGIGFLGTGAATFTNTSTITGGLGGSGGQGGNTAGDSSQGGFGGNGGSGGGGGTGFSLTTSGATLNNSGTIQGGNGGAGGTGGTGTGVHSTNGSNGSGGAGGAGVTGSNLTIINSGSILGGFAADGVTPANAITFTGGSNTLTLNPGPSLSGNIGVTGSVTFNQANGVTLSNSITGSGSVIQAGPGTLTLYGQNSYSDGTSIDAGSTLAVSADANLGASSSAVSFNGGKLQLLSNINTLQSIVLNSGGGTVDTLANTVVFSGSVSGTGGLTKVGSGTLELEGASSYSGATDVSGGTLQAGAPLAFSQQSAFTVELNATLDLNNINQTIGSLSGAGKITLGQGLGTTLTAGGDNTSTVFSGVISGGGALNKVGSGTLTLTGANSYEGDTTITAGTLQLGNGGTTTGSILSDVIDHGTLSFDQSGQVNFSGVIRGAGGVQQIGSGTLTLLGINDYSGGTTINAGTLAVSTDTNLGDPSGGITFGGAGGTLQIAAPQGQSPISFSSGRDVTLTAGGTVDTEGNTVILSGTISGTGALNKVGSGTLTLTGANAYGGTTITAGTLQLGNGGTTTGSILGNVTDDGTLSFNQSGQVNFSGVIRGTGGVQQIGSGTLTLSGINNYYGGTTINAGTLAVSTDTNLGDASGGGITFGGAGGTLQIAAPQGQSPISFSSGRTVTLNAGGTVDTEGNTVTLSGAISGAGGLSKIGAGTLTLAGTNTYTGGTTISAGVLQAANTTAAFSSASAFNVASGATLDLNGVNETVGSLTGAGTVTNSATGAAILTVGSNNTSPTDNASTTFGGTLSDGAGTLGLTKEGSGTLTLSAANGYSGPTTVSTGVLQAANTTAAFSSASAFSVASGATLDLNGVNENVGSLTGAGTVTNSATGAAILTVGSNNTSPTDNASTTFGGTLSDGAGTLGLTKEGSGTLTLSAANTYTGGTVLNQGTLAVSTDTNLGLTQPLGSTQGGITFGGGTLQILQVSGSPTPSSFSSDRVVTLNASGGTVDTNGNTATLGGTISGVGGLSKAGTGTLILTGNDNYSGGTSITAGTLQVGTGATAGSITGDVTDSGALVFDRSDTATFGGAISGTGSLQQLGTGTTILTGNNTYTGGTTLSAGTLVVNGSLGSSSVNVENATTLGGTGTINGAVTIASGGSLAPGSSSGPGTLTLGSLTLNPGASVHYVLGTANVQGGPTNDLIDVTGPLTLAGTLDVSSSGSLSLGLYRLFNYGGALVDNGLALGTLPGNFSGLIQNTIPGQVNLIVDTPGVLIKFWDGTTTNGDGLIHGGSGTWSAADTSTNWTAPNGAINASWQAGFGIFTGTAQTVTAVGPLAYQGLQFSSNGYQVSGSGTLVPLGLAPIRVDAGVTAEIAVPITGSGGVLKSDPGTLVLAAANTYSGGTTITAGTLQLGNGGTTGSITGDVSNGGTLAFDHSDTLTYGGKISGTGTVQQLGSGTTILTGNSTYSGGTTVSAGTLQLGNGGTSGSITGNVSNGGTLAFDRSDTATVNGVISGNGAVRQVGSGTTVLTGTNTYTGGTTIAAGTLQLGNGGTSGSMTGDVADNGALAFDRSDTVTFNGVISGTGALKQLGGGTTILTGNNTYSGGTTIAYSTLQVGNDGTTGSIASNVADNGGTLIFDRSDAITYGGVISGSGALQQNGSGQTTLTGANTYTGATSVNEGTLSIQGSLTSAVTVNAGATLSGNGTVGGLTLNSGSTLSPSNLNNTQLNTSVPPAHERSSGSSSTGAVTFGTITVNGSLGFQPGSVYLVAANAAGQSDSVEVNGKATLSGGTVRVLAGAGNYNPYTTYTILTASGGVTGSFSDVTSNLAFLTPTLTYDPDDVELKLTRNHTSFGSVATTGNQAAVGNAVQVASQGTLSANGQQVLGAIEGLDVPSARSAFDTLSGEGLVAAENVALVSSDLFLSSLHDQGQLWRSQTFGGSPSSATGVAAPGEEVRGWATVFDSKLHYVGNAETGSSPESDSLWGAAVGFDQAITPNVLVGLAMGGSDGDFSVSQRQTSGSVHGFHIGAYGALNLDPFYTTAELTYSTLTVQTRRTIDGFGSLAQESATGSFGAEELRGRMEMGSRIRWGSAGVTPYAAIEGAQLWSRDFTEGIQGLPGPALLGLSVAPHTTTSAPSFLGARFDDHLSIGNTMVLTPSIDLAWVHEFSDRRDMSATLTSLPNGSFTVDGARPARNGAEVRTGVELGLSASAVLYANFEGELSGGSDTYAGKLGVRVTW